VFLPSVFVYHPTTMERCDGVFLDVDDHKKARKNQWERSNVKGMMPKLGILCLKPVRDSQDASTSTGPVVCFAHSFWKTMGNWHDPEKQHPSVTFRTMEPRAVDEEDKYSACP